MQKQLKVKVDNETTSQIISEIGDQRTDSFSNLTIIERKQGTNSIDGEAKKNDDEIAINKNKPWREIIKREISNG